MAIMLPWDAPGGKRFTAVTLNALRKGIEPPHHKAILTEVAVGPGTPTDDERYVMGEHAGAVLAGAPSVRAALAEAVRLLEERIAARTKEAQAQAVATKRDWFDRLDGLNPTIIEIPLRLRRLSNVPNDIDVPCVAERRSVRLLLERVSVPVSNPDGDGFCQLLCYVTVGGQVYKLTSEELAHFLEKIADVMPRVIATDKKCSVCGERQFLCPHGITCPNGHDGAPPKED